MSDFKKEIENQFEKIGKEIRDFVDKVSADIPAAAPFRPDADVVEHDDHVLILIDLPGMERSDITLSLKEQVLTVKGERQVSYPETADVKRQERGFGAFSRSFAVSDEISAAEIKARFNSGVLTIELPKSDVLRNAENIPID